VIWRGVAVQITLVRPVGGYFWKGSLSFSNFFCSPKIISLSLYSPQNVDLSPQGYTPPRSDQREAILARKRQEYRNWVLQHHEIENSERSEDELRVLHQIALDTPRTAPAVQFFRKKEIQKYMKEMKTVSSFKFQLEYLPEQVFGTDFICACCQESWNLVCPRNE